MDNAFPDDRLLPIGRWRRGGAGLLIAGLLCCVAVWNPERGFLLPSCGFHALTGLPCLFCGGTRAAHAILTGHISYACYLNVLAFPAVTGLVAAMLLLLAEAVRGRRFVPWNAGSARFARWVPVMIFFLVPWWLIHVFFALRLPKPELVNLDRPLAACVYRWLPHRHSAQPSQNDATR